MQSRRLIIVRRNALIAFFLVATAALIFFLASSRSTSATKGINVAVKTELFGNEPSWKQKWFQCANEMVAPQKDNASELWLYYATISDACEKRSLSAESFYSRTIGYSNADETKHHITPKVSQDGTTVVSLGIGMDVEAEERLHRAFPYTVFYGADPVKENAPLYEKFGTFYNIAVGNTTSELEMLVYDPKARWFIGQYLRKTVPTIEFGSFLAHIIKPSRTLFDDIWIDVEWAEYSFLHQIHKNERLDQLGLVVCQMNIEVHAPSAEQKKIFAKWLWRVVEEKRYIFYHSSFFAGHNRGFFLNIENPLCELKYI